jgi:hypothetical protein
MALSFLLLYLGGYIPGKKGEEGEGKGRRTGIIY